MGTYDVSITAEGFKDYSTTVVLFQPLQTLYFILEPSEIGWLIRLVYAEAGGEPYLGKVGVAATVLNRVKSPSYPNDITSVIFQRVAGYVQYSPVADGRLYLLPGPHDPEAEKRAYLECIEAVKKLCRGGSDQGGRWFLQLPHRALEQLGAPSASDRGHWQPSLLWRRNLALNW